jgi:MFS family permease
MPTHTRAYLAYALGLNYAAMVSLAIAVNLIPVFLTTLGIELGGERGLTKEQLGRIGAVTFVGLVAGILLAGPLADRLGPKPFAVAGNLLIGIGLAVLALAPSYGVVLVAVLIMGLGAGILDMVLSPIVAALRPDRRSSAMNWLHSFYCVGAVATILASGLALDSKVSWRTLSLWLIAMPVAVGLGFTALRIPPLVAEGHERTRLRRLVRETYFLVALGAIFLAGATELGMAYWLPAYAEVSLRYTKWTADMAFLGFSLAMAVGRILAGLIGHRIRPITLMLGCCWASVGLFVAACFAPWPAVALGACVAAGLMGSCLWPSMLAVTADRFPRGGASMYGLLAAFGNFGGVFMPWVVGVTAGLSAMNWGLSTATLCPLGLAFMLIWMGRQAKAAPLPARVEGAGAPAQQP